MTYNTSLPTTSWDLFEDVIKFFTTPSSTNYTYTQSNPAFPPMNVMIEKNNKFIEMEIALAGFTKEQIKVESEDEYLLISAEKPEEKREDVNYIKNNLKANKFSRAFEFPDNYFDFKNPKVSFKDGLLRLRIDKNPDLVSLKRTIVIE